MAFVVKGVSSTIGLAAEKYYDHKDRKGALALQQQQSLDTSSDSRSQYDRTITDEQDWALDEAAGLSSDSIRIQEQGNDPTRSVGELVRDSITFAPEPSSSQNQIRPPRLPNPVIIPQRRPGSKNRGFARAYPPDLAAFDIDQESFLRFLKNFHSASQASPFLRVLLITAGAIGPIHGTLTFAVSISAQIALGALIEVQERYKANAFLDQMNKEVFMPKGLYAMVMMYKPSVSTETDEIPCVSIETINLETAKQIAKWELPQPSASSSSNTENETLTPKVKISQKLRGADGKTKGEAMMPLEIAPLIYPGLDSELQQPDGVRGESFKERLSRNKKFVSQYYDRRAAAEYTGNNPSTALSSTTSTTTFRSRFADPNNPVNNGTITALVTGGKYGHISPGTVGWRETDEDGRLRPVERENRVNTKMEGIKDVRGPIGLVGWGIGVGFTGVRKLLTTDVMYLTIVNMPSEDEMKEAKRVLEENKTNLADVFRG